MKKVALATIIFFLGVTSVNAYTSPGKPQGFVNDFAGVLSAEQKNSFNQSLSSFSSQTTIQVAIVTVPSLGDETIETYAVKLFEEWGIGDKEKDNGVLFLIAPTERKVRIEVGYGLEGVLTDAQSNGIIQKIILPEFKAGNLPKGIIDGTNAIVSVVQSEADYSAPVEKSTDWGNIAFMVIFLFFWLIGLLSSTKSWWLGGAIGAVGGVIIGILNGFIFTGIIAIVVLTVLGLIFDFIVSKFGGRGGRFGGPFIGGFGGGGSSGGFSGGGGFGGGSSGGGGASGSW